MFAGAAFTDSADIKATEAVNMLSALGVIDGYSDGSFKPDGTVTRAEMAKMIFVVWNGGKSDAKAYQTMDSAFADTKDHWARGYINFCASNGIIAGKGANQFAPDATVTGQEAAKMLLTVIGYDQTKAGLTGANWKQNTMSYAGMCGLFDDVDSPVESALPRQYAAQMIYNALDINRVTWSTDSNSFDDVQTWGPSGFTKETVGEKYMDYDTVTGILVEPNNGDGKGFGIIEADANGKYDFTSNLAATWSETKYTTDLTQYLGQEVKVAYDISEYHKNNASVFGVFPTDANTVVTSTLNKVKRVSSEDKIEVDGTKYKYNTTSKQVFTLGLADGDLTTHAAKFTSFNTSKPHLANDVKFVDVDSDGKFDIAITYPLGVGEVSSVSSTGMSLKTTISGDRPSATAPKLEDVTAYDGMVKGDLVAITYDYFNNKVVYSKANVVTGTINGARSDEYQIDSTWAKGATGYSLPSSLKVNDKVDAVIVNGIIYYMKKTTSGAGDDVAVVVSTGATAGGAENGKVEAKLMFSNGTTKIVNVDKFILNNGSATEVDLDGVSGGAHVNTTIAQQKATHLNNYLNSHAGTTNTVQTTDATASLVAYDRTTNGPALVTYSTDNDGNYELQLVDDTNNDANYDNVAVDANITKNGTTTVDNSADDFKYVGSYEIADDAVVMVTYGTSDVKKLNGKEFKKYHSGLSDTTASAMVSKESGFKYAKVVAVDFTAEPTGAQGSDYGYLIKKAWNSKVDGTKYVNFVMLTKDGEKTVKWDKSMSDSQVDTQYPDGALIAFDWDGENQITNVVAHFATEAAITGYDHKKKVTMLHADGTETSQYEINADTTIIYADTDENKTATGALDIANELIEDKAYVANCLYFGSGSDQMEVIVYDVNSNLYGDNMVFTKGAVAADVQNLLNNDDVDTVVVTAANLTANVTVPAGKTLLINDATIADLTHVKATEAGAVVKFVKDTAAITNPGQFYTAKDGLTGVSTSIAANSVYESVKKTGTDTIIFAPKA